MPTCSFYLSQQNPLYQRLQQEENASAAIRQALEAWYDGQDDDQLASIQEQLDRIEARLEECMIKPSNVEIESTDGHDEVDVSAIDEAMAQW